VFAGNHHCGRCGAPVTAPDPDPGQATSPLPAPATDGGHSFMDPLAPTYQTPQTMSYNARQPVVAQPDPPVPGWPKPPQTQAQRRSGPSTGKRLFSRPPGYPNVGAWVVTGMFRDGRAIVGALLIGVLNLPIAFLFGGLGLIGGGIAAVTGFAGTTEPGPFGIAGAETVQGIPIVGPAAESLLFRSGGVVSLLAGLVLGGLGGFLYGLALPWVAAFEDPVSGVGLLSGQVFAAFLLGVVHTLYRIAAEGWSLRTAGAREPSRRERELLAPLLLESSQRLRLGSYPKILIQDAKEPHAYCGARHIVVNTGLLDEFDYDPEPLSAVLCHQLAHWRNADAVSGFFVRGMILPYYLLYAAVKLAMSTFRHALVRLVLWLVSWPLLLSVRLVFMPLQAKGRRSAEFAADQAAVAAGHRQGLRRVLSRLQTTFDGARNGWDASICATHPATEHRLERTEEADTVYPLPDPDAPARPLPVVVTTENLAP
jgi:Zn-dependent protease with chaperone function